MTNIELHSCLQHCCANIRWCLCCSICCIVWCDNLRNWSALVCYLNCGPSSLYVFTVFIQCIVREWNMFEVDDATRVILLWDILCITAINFMQIQKSDVEKYFGVPSYRHNYFWNWTALFYFHRFTKIIEIKDISRAVFREL